MVAPRVYQAMAQNVVGHLDPFFFEVAGEIRSLLGYIFSTENQFNLAISGTGSSGMEAAVANFAEPGRKFALLTNGFFGDRIGEMARRQGAEVVRLAKPWGQPYDPQEARDFIRREQPHMVAFVQAETSTGMFNQAKPICEAAHEAGALVIADCVTSLGGMPVLVDENGIDIAYSCTQKGLGCPPGLAPMTVSPRALERLKARHLAGAVVVSGPAAAGHLLQRPQIPPYGVGHHVLRVARGPGDGGRGGRENRWERHRRNHLAFVAGIEAMGLEMHVTEPRRIVLWTLNTPRVPEGVDDAKVRKYPAGKTRHRDRRRIRAAGGTGLPHRPDGLRLDEGEPVPGAGRS
jgi:alanine-glyoxylate transaminase/serine-glyoxylate transaminase/serine-pyruvate transaminase